MADFELIRKEGDEQTVVTVRVPDWLWSWPKPLGLNVEVISIRKEALNPITD